MTTPPDPHDPRFAGRPPAPGEGGTPETGAHGADHDLGDLFADLADEQRAMSTDAPDEARSEDRADPAHDAGARGGRRDRGSGGRGNGGRGRRPSSPMTHKLRELTPTLIAVVAAVSAVEAALSPAQPVGLRAADAVWCALLGAGVVLAASRARRWALIWLGGLSAVVGISGDATAKVSAVVALLLVGIVVFSDRRDRLTAALIGAVAVQALLRGPDYGFVGLPTVVGAAAIAPAMWSGYRMARTRERKITRRFTYTVVGLVALASIGAAVAGLESRSGLEAGEDKATSGLDLVRAAETPAAAESFGLAALEFERASDRLEGPLTWAGRYVPVVGQHVDTLRTVASAGQDLGDSAAITASTADYRTLTAQDGQVDLAQVVALQKPVADSAATVTAALDAVDSVRSPWLVRPVDHELDRFRDKLADVAQQTELAAEALAVAPALLGADGTARYFVAMSTPAESRNGGGFIGAYGLLEATAGKLDLLEAGNLGALNPPGGFTDPYAFDPPPDWEKRYGAYFVDVFLGNSGASPNWPTNRDVIGQLFPQTPDGTEVDGAIYADPAALAGLLRLTGPVEVEIEGETLRIDHRNVEQFLLVDQYIQFDGDNPERKELLGDVADATFAALTSRPLPGIADLTDVLGPLVEDGHLRLSVFDDRPEAFFDRIGLSGRWSVPDGADVLSVRSANLFANKIDSFLFRDIDVATVIDPDTGELTSTVTVRLRNTAPGEGLPRYIIGNANGLPFGTNRQVVTLHTPHVLDAVTVDGLPRGVQAQTEFGGPVYSATVDVGPGATRTVVFELSGVVPAWPYRLQIVPQPTANPDQMTVSVDGAPKMGPAPQFRGELGPVVRLPDQPGSD